MANNINKIAKSLKKSIKTEKGTKAYDTAATVTRIEGKTAWVHIPGGVDETPVKLTMNAKKGETVQVRVSGGKAWLTGNASAPPTDDTRAIQAQTIATDASRNADIARNAADSAVASAASASASAVTAYNKAQEAATSATNAQTSANNAAEYASRALGNLSTVQSVAETLTWITQHGTMALTTDTALDPTHVYFIRDNNGDYQVGSYKYSIVAEPNVDNISTYYELTIDESLNNYVGTHLALTNEGLWLLPAASGTNKVLIATGAGSTYTTAGTYIIGSSGETLAKFSTNGLSVTTKKNNDIVEIANLGYGLGNAASGTAEAPYYTLGIRKSGEAVGNYSVAEGNGTTASALGSHAEGGNINVSGVWYYLTASGTYAHAEGCATTASGRHSHSEGYLTTASGDWSHAQNRHTIADQSSQTAIGKYNTANINNNLFVIGNGTADDSRSNAFTVDTSGNVGVAGDVNIASGKHYKINGTNLSASDVGAVPTSRTVNSKALSSNITLTASDVGALATTGGTLSGTLTLSSHSSAIGTVKQAYAAAKSVSSGTNTNLTSLSLEAGTWVVTGGVRFPNNATGYRRMNITTTSAAVNADVQLPALSGASTQLAYTLIVSPTSTTTYYLNCYHNAGTALSLVAGGGENGVNFIRAVRIA